MWGGSATPEPVKGGDQTTLHAVGVVQPPLTSQWMVEPPLSWLRDGWFDHPFFLSFFSPSIIGWFSHPFIYFLITFSVAHVRHFPYI